MADTNNAYLTRIDQLLSLEITPQSDAPSDSIIVDELFKGTLGITVALYGAKSPQAEVLLDAYAAVLKANRWDTREQFFFGVKGTLKNLRSEIELGLIRSFRNEAIGEVLGDLTALSKEILHGGYKDAAAVLAAAALEDGFKRVAMANGLDPSGKEMSDVIALLKANGILSGAEGPIAQSFTKFRNKALHAEWDAIDVPAINSALGFLESFLVKHLS